MHMDVQRTGHWLGKPLSQLPHDVFNELKFYFDLKEHNDDVSILSEPNVQFSFFFLDETSNYPLLLVAQKIAQNLGKHLIVLYQGRVNKELFNHSVIYSHISVDSDHFNSWLQDFTLKVHLSFDSHREVLEQVKNEPLIIKNNVGKEIISILRYVEDNLDKVIKEDDIAKQCHYSVTYFSKLFHKVVGISFRDYVCNKRINNAKKMLISDRKIKISFIAYQCGYKDVSYFSRIFKKKTGMSPGTFRTNH